jgi:catechol 2,3-dioxygenase-like lactoylglutathione lyase family enzyme
MSQMKIAAALAALVAAGCAHAQGAGGQTITTPEGAQMSAATDLAYKPGQLTQEQLSSSTRSLFAQGSANVFRRYPREQTAEMVKFYTEALALRSLSPIQLTATQQMILTGVGSGQIKLSAGQAGNRKYDLSGGVTGGTGIRFFSLTYPTEFLVSARFERAGLPAPQFRDQGDGTKAAMVTDPGGFPIQLVIRPNAQDGSNDGVGVGIGVSNLERSRAFYRDFVGLDELAPVQDRLLRLTKYPYRHGETTLYLYQAGPNPVVDNGSAGIQYVVRDAPMVDAKAKHRGGIAVETPLNKLAGFDLVTVWLNDPDGVTNYFAQVNRSVQPPGNRSGG